MRISTAIALTLSVFAVSTRAAPVPDLFGPVSNLIGGALPGSSIATAPQTESLDTPEKSLEKRDGLLGGLFSGLTGTSASAQPQTEAVPDTSAMTESLDTPETSLEKRDGLLGGLFSGLTGTSASAQHQTETVANPSAMTESLKTPEPLFEKRDGLLGGLFSGLTGASASAQPQTEAVPDTSAMTESLKTPEPSFEKRDGLLGGLFSGLTGTSASAQPQMEAVPNTSAMTESLKTPEPSFEKRDGLLGGLFSGLTGTSASAQPQTEAVPDTSAMTESLDTPETSLEKRGIPVHVSAIVDLLVKANAEIIVKALTTLKANVCTDIRSKLHLVATGLLTADTDVVIPKISAKIEDETRLAVNTKIDLDLQVLVLAKIRAHALQVLVEICPHGNDECLLDNVGKIVADVEALVQIDISKLFIALKTNLMTHVRAKVEVVIRELGLNLLVEQIHIQGFVDAVAEVNVHLDLCAHVIGRNIHILTHAKANAMIRSICRA